MQSMCHPTHAQKTPHKQPPCFGTFNLFVSLRQLLQCVMVHNRQALLEASKIVKQLWELQYQIKTFQEDINVIRCPSVSRIFLNLKGATTRIEGMTWAEEMDLRDPVDEKDETEGPACEKVLQVEIGTRTEQHLTRSFVSINNTEQRQLCNAFALPKVAITKAPTLDPVMFSQCSKSTKKNDKALTRDQALTLTPFDPLLTC